MSVGAVNKQTGERIPTAGMPAVDSVLSGTSTNPVQNRVVKAAFDGKQDTLTFDDTPTDGSNNPVKSNGIYDSEKDIYAAMGEMGAKNLNSYPYNETTHTDNGVDWTDNKDGTVTANNAATGNSTFLCHARQSASANRLIVPNGSYILTGCPTGGSDSTYRISANITKNGSAVVLGTDYGNGVIITVNGDDNYQDKAIIQIGCDVRNGYTASNLTFRPMLRLASDTDDTYQQYAKTNKQLTDDVALLDSKKADTDMVAADFNAGTSYTAGNYCVQDGKLYKFKNNHSGAWSSADVDEVKITGELSALKSGLMSRAVIVAGGEISSNSSATVQLLSSHLYIVTLGHPYSDAGMAIVASYTSGSNKVTWIKTKTGVTISEDSSLVLTIEAGATVWYTVVDMGAI